MLGWTMSSFRQLQSGVAAGVPAAGQVGRDPDHDTGVVAAPQRGEQARVHGGAVVAGGVDLVNRAAQGVGDLAGPQLDLRVDVVGVLQIPEQMRQALLNAGQVGVVADVAAEVVTDQDPAEVVQDPERADRGLRAVTGGAVPDQVGPASGVGAHRADGVHVRVVAARLGHGFVGQRGGRLVGAQHLLSTQCGLERLLEPGRDQRGVQPGQAGGDEPGRDLDPSSADNMSAVRSIPITSWDASQVAAAVTFGP